jgi:hypothetical protein
MMQNRLFPLEREGNCIHCGCCPLTNGRRTTLIVAQKGKPSAAQVIARSMAEPDSRSKNAKIWAMPSRNSTADQPDQNATDDQFLEHLSEGNDLAYGLPWCPDQCSVLR